MRNVVEELVVRERSHTSGQANVLRVKENVILYESINVLIYLPM